MLTGDHADRRFHLDYRLYVGLYSSTLPSKGQKACKQHKIKGVKLAMDRVTRTQVDHYLVKIWINSRVGAINITRTQITRCLNRLELARRYLCSSKFTLVAHRYAKPHKGRGRQRIPHGSSYLARHNITICRVCIKQNTFSVSLCIPSWLYPIASRPPREHRTRPESQVPTQPCRYCIFMRVENSSEILTW